MTATDDAAKKAAAVAADKYILPDGTDPKAPEADKIIFELKRQREMTPDEVQAEIVRLAGLSALDYARERQGAAARTGYRLRTLDVIVEDERKRIPDPTDSGLDRVPSLEPVTGPVLVHQLISDLTNYVSLEAEYAAMVAFWTLHTYLVKLSPISPRLAITAPQPRCGKTTLMDWLFAVVQRPLPSVNISAAAVYHIIEEQQPTLLIDEADTFLANDNELRGILNSGHKKNGSVLRWDSRLKRTRAYPTFSACAISMIGALPGTLQDRSVQIRLRRRRSDEKIESLRTDRMSDEIARRCARWALDNESDYASADPEIPRRLINRVADNWRPLLALANVVGGKWPTLLREIAVRMAELAAGEDPSLDTQLLRDIRDIIKDREWVTTHDLLSGLNRRECSMSGKRLAGRLKPYGVEPKQERRGTSVERGYLAKDFADVFARSLDVPVVPLVPDQTVTPTKPEVGSGGPFATDTTGTNGTA
jgi:putative DNA primase/helicase